VACFRDRKKNRTHEGAAFEVHARLDQALTKENSNRSREFSLELAAQRGARCQSAFVAFHICGGTASRAAFLETAFAAIDNAVFGRYTAAAKVRTRLHATLLAFLSLAAFVAPGATTTLAANVLLGGDIGCFGSLIFLGIFFFRIPATSGDNEADCDQQRHQTEFVHE
jgi:hypothetical protein